MKDLALKLRFLPSFVLRGFDEWRSEIWSRDLDTRWCCDGRECCCGGWTVRDELQFAMRRQ